MKFKLGEIVATINALRVVSQNDINEAITRHSNADWGDVCQEDKQLNDNALNAGERLLSSYKTSNGVKFWIITEWDRSITTILLPEDY